jgi:serine/threonine protein kinase
VLQDQQSFADPFAHSQCSRLAEAYEGFEKLGEGSTGVVYKVRARTDNKEVAIKVMRMDDEEQLQIAQKEYDLLKHVNHPNIIRALDFFTFSMGAVLVLDYFEGKKLAKTVREAPDRHLQESTARHLCAQLLGAVSHLHSCGVIHRDIKADNILVSLDLTDLRLVDFNAAKQLTESQALTMTGTVDYMPPEVLSGESPSQAGDIWAIGLCLYLMLSGRLPSERRALRLRLDSLDEVPLYQGSLVRLDGDEWNRFSRPCKEVVSDCLKVYSRPTASTILAMPWLAVQPEPEA